MDANDNPPAFTHSSYSFEVPENAPRGYQVGIVNAFDADVGNNAVVTYTVISDWGNDVFTLNPQTGVFTLTARLDYEDVSCGDFFLSRMIVFFSKNAKSVSIAIRLHEIL